ncbi:hypothetical protein O9G_006013 [Rozella allomycis CSF55]|uniref:Uncharacterized protein n=1 Tax=Rozella allomycis (strain CSF55) TaxID=988480 RepID=A0A075B173_ROZAC|nr:hypothetical protein O9G_006013 [Rozella allomycis CSF55]|eukprot:EPZ36334.1 hypothetical protein O9G_006013 [Rozella allomycis CSF55]
MMNKHFLFLQPGRRWHVIENAIKETYLPTFQSFMYGDTGRWNKELQDEFAFLEMTRGNVSFNSWEMHAVEGWSTVGMYVSDEDPVLHPWMLTNHYYWYRPGKRDVVSSYHDGNEVVRCYPLAVIGGNEERGMEHERLERFHRFQWQMYNFYGIYHGRETSEISYCVLVQGRGRSEIVNLKEVVEGIEGVLRLRVVYMERMKSMGERIETFAYSRCLISADESVFENLYFMGGRSLILEITGGSRGEEVSGGDRSGGDRSEGDGDGEIGRSESESDRRGRTSSDRRSRTSSKSYAERISNELFYRYYNFKAKVVRDESDQMNNRGMYVNMTRFMHDFIRII